MWMLEWNESTNNEYNEVNYIKEQETPKQEQGRSKTLTKNKQEKGAS